MREALVGLQASLLEEMTKVGLMPDAIKWTSIDLFHYVVRTYQHLNENDGLPLPTVSYRAKVKIHGTNCGVQVRPDGIYPQGRTTMLSLPSGDYKGFARWVADHQDYWSAIEPGITVFGEWCGLGIEKNSAIYKCGRKVYAVFAVQVGYEEDARIVYEPSQIQALLPDVPHPDVFVLPWYEPGAVTIDYADQAAMDAAVAQLNQLIANIEAEDPWVKEVFGLSGMGEGLVLYPIEDHSSSDPERLGRTMFKAKGIKHSRVRTKKPVQVAPEVATSISDFVDLMVTPSRLEQAVTEACGGEYHMRHTGALLRWLTDDVQKESVAELEAAKLTWKQVLKAVQARGREWFKAQCLSS
jgi:hypothetical protein